VLYIERKSNLFMILREMCEISTVQVLRWRGLMPIRRGCPIVFLAEVLRANRPPTRPETQSLACVVKSNVSPILSSRFDRVMTMRLLVPRNNLDRIKTAESPTCCHERIARSLKAFCDKSLESWLRERHFMLCPSWYVMVCHEMLRCYSEPKNITVVRKRVVKVVSTSKRVAMAT
jgi:hypothetical protein